MSKSKIIIWLPVFLGLLLVVVTKIDLYQFHNQSIELKPMLSREIPIVLIGLLLSGIVFLSSIYWLSKKQWAMVFQSVISPLLFMVLLSIGGAMGGAYFNAT